MEGVRRGPVLAGEAYQDVIGPVAEERHLGRAVSGHVGRTVDVRLERIRVDRDARGEVDRVAARWRLRARVATA
jgi:hypothetical protein